MRERRREGDRGKVMSLDMMMNFDDRAGGGGNGEEGDETRYRCGSSVDEASPSCAMLAGGSVMLRVLRFRRRACRRSGSTGFARRRVILVSFLFYVLWTLSFSVHHIFRCNIRLRLPHVMLFSRLWTVFYRQRNKHPFRHLPHERPRKHPSRDSARAPSSRVRSSLTAARSWTTSKTSGRNTSSLTTTPSRMPLRSASSALMLPNGVESPRASRLHLRTLGHASFVFGAPPPPDPTLLHLCSSSSTTSFTPAVLPPTYALHTALPAAPHTLLGRYPSFITPSSV
ncbi:hypothetical protein B0H14DRAFT_1304189 [Mycena olivaceomarginata]|nr:hypothetical protein B0H14DRAFT_1304189 [Mycena olivaceomarginata]